MFSKLWPISQCLAWNPRFLHSWFLLLLLPFCCTWALVSLGRISCLGSNSNIIIFEYSLFWNFFNALILFWEIWFEIYRLPLPPSSDFRWSKRGYKYVRNNQKSLPLSQGPKRKEKKDPNRNSPEFQNKDVWRRLFVAILITFWNTSSKTNNTSDLQTGICGMHVWGESLACGTCEGHFLLESPVLGPYGSETAKPPPPPAHRISWQKSAVILGGLHSRPVLLKWCKFFY